MVNGTSSLEDGQLLAAARDGDRAAFATLVDRHKDQLVTYLTRLTGRHDRAEDLAQESFLRLYERSQKYIEQGKLRAYLFRIATNLLRSEERQQRRRRFLGAIFLSSNGHHASPRQESKLLQDEIGRRVSEAIAALPSHYRVPLILHELEGWPYRDIGPVVGCREGTVKSRIFRGRQLLRQQLEPFWLGETA